MEPYSPTLQAEVTKFLQLAIVIPKGENQPHSIVFTSPIDAVNILQASHQCCITSSIRVADLEPLMIIAASLGDSTPFFVGVCYSGHGQRFDDFFEATARVITTCRQKTRDPQTLHSLSLPETLASMWPKISFQKLASFGVKKTVCDGLRIIVWERTAAFAIVRLNQSLDNRDAFAVAWQAGSPCF